MKRTTFYAWLLLTAAVSTLALYWMAGGSIALQKAALGMVVFFVVFTQLMYHLGLRSSRSANPFLFTQIFMVSVLFKIVLLTLFVVVLLRLMEVNPRQLAAPLGTTYVLFTILETWVLMRLSKLRA